MNQAIYLALLTLRSPPSAAQLIQAQRWQGEVVWTALALVAVLDALLYGTMVYLTPIPDGDEVLTLAPVVYMGVSGGLTVLSTAVVSFCGRMIGGQARFSDLLPLVVWLQFVGFVVQLLLAPITLLSGGIGALANLGIGIYLFIVYIHFVNAAHGFNSLLRAFGVLLISGLLALFAIVFGMGLLGPDNLGLPAYV